VYSDMLDPTNWITLSNIVGNGGELFFTNNAPLPAARWYRVTSP
jgi:hypothetical protein